MLFGLTHEFFVMAALYISEGWYAKWEDTGKLYCKARAMVVYDRALSKSYNTDSDTV